MSEDEKKIRDLLDGAFERIQRVVGVVGIVLTEGGGSADRALELYDEHVVPLLEALVQFGEAACEIVGGE